MFSMLDNYTVKLLIQVPRLKPPYPYLVVPMRIPHSISGRALRTDAVEKENHHTYIAIIILKSINKDI